MSFKVTIRKILMLIAMFYICISLFFFGRYVYAHMNGDSNVKTKDELIKERVSFLKRYSSNVDARFKEWDEEI